MAETSLILCEVYKCSKIAELYIYLAKGKTIDSLPAELVSRLGKPSKVMDLKLTPERKLARVDVQNVIEHIQRDGFYVQMPPGEYGRREM